MKIQWEILLFMLCLNLTFGIVIALAVPGTEYVNPAGPVNNATEYEEHFNATDIAKGWDSTPFTGIPLIGDIFAGVGFLWQNLQYLVDGFPILLTYVRNTYITDLSGQLAFDIIANALRAVYAVLMVMFVIELISGRIFTD